VTRIIGGVLGSLKLKGPAKVTRPTSDRVKESVFSILEARGAIQNARVLDLFAGTGALGLEAASRGAASVTLVERDPAAAKVCEENLTQVVNGLSKSGFDCDVRLVRSDAKSYLKKDQQADLVFVDPPYAMAHSEILNLLQNLNLSGTGIVVLERPEKEIASAYEAFLIKQEKSYGDTKVVFLARDGAR
jgi:16S rRNA (guanine966-N2)-methyltransferase